MATIYSTAAAFRNTYFDAQGVPLIDGQLFSYEATNHATPKAIYSSRIITPPATEPPAYANPIVLDSGAAVSPLFYSSDSNYYLELRTSVATGSALIESVDDWNSEANISPQPTTDEIDFTNYIINPDYTVNIRAGFDKDALPVSVTKISQPEWYFTRSNTTAEVSINFNDFVPGQTDVPDQPAAYLSFQSATAGSAETVKDIFFTILDVRSFNADKITIGYYAKSDLNNQIEILLTQNFGTNGSAEVVTSISTQLLTNSWTQYTIIATVPSINGKNIDLTDCGYLAVKFRMPLNAVSKVDLTKSQLNRGNILLEYNYLPKRYTTGRSLAVSTPPVPSNRIDTYEKYTLTSNYDGNVSWLLSMPPGMIIDWPSETAPDGWHECNGFGVLRWRYQGLWDVITDIYGWFYTTASIALNAVTVTAKLVGATTAAADVSTGFTVVRVVQGDPGSHEVFRVTTTAAAAVTPGSHFTFSTAEGTRNWFVWVVIDNEGTMPVVSGATQVILNLNSWDTANEVAGKLKDVLLCLEFAVPDLRGYVIRSWDHGEGRDPNAAARTAPPGGTITGDHVGTVQLDEFKSHHHTQEIPELYSSDLHGAAGGDRVRVIAALTGDTGGDETRGKNVYMMKIIKL
jgi:hypothetical protein